MSERILRKHHPPEFKAEAIKRVLKQGYSCHRAGPQLGIPHKTLANRVRPQRQQQRSAQIATGVAQDDPAALRARSAKLEKQLRRAEMEREILKSHRTRAQPCLGN